MENNACPYCGTDSALYQQTYSTKLYIGRLGGFRILEIETHACPPYADCSIREFPTRSAFIINFCPHCGRDLRLKEEGTP